jgi:hypothetical protein
MTTTTAATTNTGFLKSLVLASATIAASTMVLGSLWLHAHGF